MRHRTRPDAFVSREFASELVLVPLNTAVEKVYQLNATGLALLEALREWRTEEEAAELLRTRFDATPEDDVAGDVRRFLTLLREAGFVDSK